MCDDETVATMLNVSRNASLVYGNGLSIVIVVAEHDAEIDHRVHMLWIQSDGPVIMLPGEPCSIDWSVMGVNGQLENAASRPDLL